MRQAKIDRKTNETNISLSIDLDGKGDSNINTGCGFLNHMLCLFSKHSSIDLHVVCKGDVDVDYHHTTEDIAIALGEAFNTALGDKKGITRYADAIVPMDESLILSAIDISGRSFINFDCSIDRDKVGDFDTELTEEFWQAFVRSAKVTLHIRKINGVNAHHIIEAIFKSCAVSIKKAIKIDTRNPSLPSTKGVI